MMEFKQIYRVSTLSLHPVDLYNHYRMLRNENSESSRDDIAKELTEVLVRIYNLASIPTISEIK